MTDAAVVLNQLNLVVKDIRASAAFYRRLGIRIEDPPRDAEPYHVNGEATSELDFDLDIPSFARIWNPGWTGHEDLAGRVVIGFHVGGRDRVDALYDELTGAGYRSLAAPYDAFWGVRYAVVEDPDGIAVGLMSDRDRSRSFWPPENWPG